MIDHRYFLRYFKEYLMGFHFKITNSKVSAPVFTISILFVLALMMLLGFDVWILRRLFEKDSDKIF